MTYQGVVMTSVGLSLRELLKEVHFIKPHVPGVNTTVTCTRYANRGKSGKSLKNYVKKMFEVTYVYVSY